MDIKDAWKSTCKILLGGEIGELDSFEDYLSEYVDLTLKPKKSVISGKTVFTSADDVCNDARFISNDESEEYRKRLQPKLSINDLKDLDSILGALGEVFTYSGGIYLGNSRDILDSDRCIDSTSVYKSQFIQNQNKYVAFSNQLLECECCFGLDGGGKSKFVIKGYNAYIVARCMEVLRTYNSSDCYYTANLEACTNCMFSFNLRNTSFRIGNLQLPKDRYAQLKHKLLSDIRDTLKSKKRIPSIIDVVSGGRRAASNAVRSVGGEVEKSQLPALKKIDDAFASTAQVVLGKRLGPLMDYERWLTAHTRVIVKAKSAVSGKMLAIPPLPFYLAMENRTATMDESLELGKLRLSESEVEKLSLSNSISLLEKISCTTTEDIYGKVMDIVDCACYGNATYAFKGYYVYDSKYSAYSYWPKYSDYVFGCFMVFHSNYCINCHGSTNLSRCFEVDGSNNCTDTYFSHNCEGLSNCIFCFNTKSLRYAIGNVEVGREKYMEIKKLVLDEIVNKLESDKNLEIDIYSIGCYKPKK